MDQVRPTRWVPVLIGDFAVLCLRQERVCVLQFWQASLVSCGPKQSFVTPPETGVLGDAGEEAQGWMSSLNERCPAPWPAWDGDRAWLCWLREPGLQQHEAAFVEALPLPTTVSSQPGVRACTSPSGLCV